MSLTIWTIGYTGVTADQLVTRLTDERIERLVDIREIPLSRKKGLSKSALSGRLANVRIEYSHIKALGSPKALRHKVRDDSDYRSFFSALRKVYGHDDVTALMSLLIADARERRTCLMCCCSDWSRCHRSVVSSILSTTFDATMEHLQFNTKERDRKAA